MLVSLATIAALEKKLQRQNKLEIYKPRNTRKTRKGEKVAKQTRDHLLALSLELER